MNMHMNMEGHGSLDGHGIGWTWIPEQTLVLGLTWTWTDMDPWMDMDLDGHRSQDGHVHGFLGGHGT